MIRTINIFITLLRPAQWLKNLLLLFPPFFGGKILEPAVFAAAIPSIFSFSCAASCCYIINDIRDRESDKQHPAKKDRAIAHGDVPIVIASILAAFFYLTAILIASSVSMRFQGFLIIYFFVSFLYTFYFKEIFIIDVFVIALGFLIRVAAGGEAFHVTVSNWLLLSVFMVSLVLAFGKRLGELVSLGGNAPEHRITLARYSLSFLEGVIWFSASGALITYAFYILERRGSLFYTILLAAYGLIRYIYIVKQGKGDPTEALLKDRQILAIGITWAVSIGLIIYK
jgi:decaprenyl-phosphate phosphoribosyltransferase